MNRFYGVPNLDEMSVGELMEFYHRYQGGRSRKEAADLLGFTDRGYLSVAADLANYAANKATAISCRLRGTISVALQYDEICEVIYAELPTRVKR